jgi:dTDP-4-amino-4,6-dideoxygalactose transaminase
VRAPELTAPYRVPFNKPSIQGRELQYIAEAVDGGRISGDGQFTEKCSAFLAEAFGAARVMLTTSGTHALEMAALLLDIQPGDEVIVPSYTFVSTANAFVLRGAKPVFIDICPDTLNLDERLLLDLITDRTRAIVPVHYGGVGCEMDAIMDIAGACGIPVIEDNAHGIFATYRDRPLGSFGLLSAVSFHETKTIQCGEGGALVVNDPEMVGRAEFIREKGTNRSQFFRGEVRQYNWVDIGSSFLPSDILAAFLWGQLERKDEILTARRSLWDRYHTQLSDWAAASDVRLPCVPSHCRHSGHLYYLIMSDASRTQRLIDHLAARGIYATFHYLPLHRSPFAARCGSRGDCPVTEDISQRIVRLPFYTTLTSDDQEYVIRSIVEFK